MHIECPHCATSNKIEFAEHIICCECDKSFKGQSFGKLKKPLISAGTAAIIGLVSGFKIEQLMDENRYPVSVEYAIVDTCVNSSAQPLSISQYKDKRQVCLCAVEATVSQVSYRDFKESQILFNEPFKVAITACNRGS
ncbi:hypothetical protein [Grimontia sp. SpTr1]|uniref:hypothetical protein n=1 Tax=Grimontia sp. SpTr1 TaxID=2995319 RepID=UPI00248AA929|nr:hypothetical protein [Grimontia sp. SpTr1]